MLKPLHFKEEINAGKREESKNNMKITCLEVRNTDLKYEPQRRGGAEIGIMNSRDAGIGLLL